MRDATFYKGRGLNYFQSRNPFYDNFQLIARQEAPGPTIPAWKRALDIVCVTAASVVWVPAGILIGTYIKVVSPGPVLFRQARVGFLGRPFCCLKFRTMRSDADVSVHKQHLGELIRSNQPMKKLDEGDSRLIPGAVWIRALGLDELPQLINVLLGDMSLVGPRPCVPYEFELFETRYRERCNTPPGLTGLWQVNGKNRTTFEQMMEFDLAYVKKKSLLMDLKIILSTVPALLVQLLDAVAARRLRLRLRSVPKPVVLNSEPACKMHADQ